MNHTHHKRSGLRGLTTGVAVMVAGALVVLGSLAAPALLQAQGTNPSTRAR